MSDTKFTPGPWTRGRYAETHIDAGAGRGICSTGGYQTNTKDPDAVAAENLANAYLIAAAAPDLYAALEDMLSGWIYIREQHGDLSGVGWDRAQVAATAALAKARGEA